MFLRQIYVFVGVGLLGLSFIGETEGRSRRKLYSKNLDRFEDFDLAQDRADTYSENPVKNEFQSSYENKPRKTYWIPRKSKTGFRRRHKKPKFNKTRPQGRLILEAAYALLQEFPVLNPFARAAIDVVSAPYTILSWLYCGITGCKPKPQRDPKDYYYYNPSDYVSGTDDRDSASRETADKYSSSVEAADADAASDKAADADAASDKTVDTDAAAAETGDALESTTEYDESELGATENADEVEGTTQEPDTEKL